ncbi:MAG: glycosyltransferase family A protein, partial [Pseudomonadota bacterium]
WIAGLREQNPPIAPNLPSLSSLRSQALRGPAAQRLTAASALDNCYRVLASVERLSSGKLEEAEADAIASSQSLEVLLAHGLYTELGEALIKLILGQQEQIFADERTLRWALRAAGSCGMESKITHTLARSAPAIIAAYPDLLRQVFETLASALPSDRIATVLLACIASSPASKTARFRHRVAEISRLYLEGPGARQVFAACGSDPHPQSVQAGFAVALSRDGSDFDWPLPPLEALQLAISDRDREAITAVSRAFAENDTPLLDYLDLLRPFAKELAEMDLDETVLPFHRCRDDHEVALLALISGSESRMAALRQEDNGEIGEELKAMIAASLCDSAAFIDHVNALSGDLGPKLAQLAPISQRWIFQAYTEAPSMEVEPSDGRVSVVMSSLDTDEDLIVPAVESILAQSHEDLELLLIDDGSSRSHLEVLLEIAKRDPRIRAYTMPRNLGPYLCRNFALSVATGCFLAIQDADDIAHPDRLALQVAAMHHEPARQLVTSHHLRIDPRGWPQLEHGFRLLGDGTMTSLFRRSVFDQLGPFLPVRSRGDVEMRERIRKWCGAHALHQIDFPLVACHASPQTLSQRTVAAKGNFLRLFRKGIDAIQPHPEHLGPYATSQISIPAALQA